MIRYMVQSVAFSKRALRVSLSTEGVRAWADPDARTQIRGEVASLARSLGAVQWEITHAGGSLAAEAGGVQ